MNNKKGLLVLLIAMVVLIGGASFLYEKLGEQVERPGLVVQEGAGTLTGTGNSQAGASGGQDGNATADENTGLRNENGSGTSTNAGNASGSNATPDGNTSGSSATPDDTTLTLAPDFTVYDAEGNPFKLSEFRGKPVILNFWASWCGPCKSEMPDFQELYEEYGGEIHFLMVNMTDGYQETVESASKFVADAGYTFPVYYDTASEAAYTYNVYSIPTTFFIDGEGYGIAYGSGAMNKEIIMTGINMIQSEK